MAANLKYHAALIVANALYGVNYSYFSSTIADTLSADDLFYIRVLFSAVIFMPYILLAKIWRVKSEDIGAILIFTLLVTAGRQFMLIKSLSFTSPMDSSIISTLGPIMIMIISAITLKERLTRWRTIGMVVGFAGTILLLFSSGAKGGNDSIKGIAMMMVSITAISINTVHAKGVLAKYNALTVVGWSSLIGAVVAAPLFMEGILELDTSKWSSAQWGEMVYIVAGGTIAATGLLYYGLKHVSATAVSVYFYIQPVVATSLAIARGQDRLTPLFLISAAVIFSGVAMVQHIKQK